MPAVHQFAGGGLPGKNFQHRARRLLQTVEQQQSHTPRPGQRLRGQRGLGDQGQRSFGTDQQPGHVEIIVAQHAVEIVAAAVHGTF